MTASEIANWLERALWTFCEPDVHLLQVDANEHLTVKFEDANHFTQEWTSNSKGKEESAVFKWTRQPKK